MPTPLLPDPELVAVQWAKADPDISAIVEGRVSTSLPQTERPVFPWLRVFVIPGAGPPFGAEYPVMVSLLQWDAFAAGAGDDRATPDFATASLLARTVASKVREFDGYQGQPLDRSLTFDGETALVDAFQVTQNPGRLNEPLTGWARYRLDTLLRLRPG